MGRQERGQGQLFYEFNLDDVIPQDHLLRRMNIFVTGTLADLRFDSRRNVYFCPAGETLTTSGRVHSHHAIRYFASVPRCRECPLKHRPNRRLRELRQ
jgi:hypothetical protein